MGLLTVSTGDVIEIRDEVKGAKKTVAKCLRLHHLDEGKGIIRVDGLGRNNAGVAIGDTVVIRKIKAIPAEKVILLLSWSNPMSAAITSLVNMPETESSV